MPRANILPRSERSTLLGGVRGSRSVWMRAIKCRDQGCGCPADLTHCSGRVKSRPLPSTELVAVCSGSVTRFRDTYPLTQPLICRKLAANKPARNVHAVDRVPRQCAAQPSYSMIEGDTEWCVTLIIGAQPPINALCANHRPGCTYSWTEDGNVLGAGFTAAAKRTPLKNACLWDHRPRQPTRPTAILYLPICRPIKGRPLLQNHCTAQGIRHTSLTPSYSRLVPSR